MRMNCTCGEYLSNSATPNDVELWVYTDREWDAILENDTIETWKIPLPTHDVWRCPKCERIYVFGKPNEDGCIPVIKVYRLEELPTVES